MLIALTDDVVHRKWPDAVKNSAQNKEIQSLQYFEIKKKYNLVTADIFIYLGYF